MGTVDKIISQLTQLSPSERAILKAAIEALEVKSSKDDTEWLYEIASSLLVQGNRIPYKSFLKSSYGAAWKTKAQIACDFFNSTFPSGKQNSRAVLARMILNQLCNNLREKGVVPTMGILTNSMDSLPAIFESLFPGYRANGLAHLVIDAMGGKKHADHD